MNSEIPDGARTSQRNSVEIVFSPSLGKRRCFRKESSLRASRSLFLFCVVERKIVSSELRNLRAWRFSDEQGNHMNTEQADITDKRFAALLSKPGKQDISLVSPRSLRRKREYAHNRINHSGRLFRQAVLFLARTVIAGHTAA